MELKKILTVILLAFSLSACSQGNFFMWHNYTTSQPIAIPTLTTLSVNNPGETTAVSGGSISSDGGGIIYVKGVQWSLNSSFSSLVGSTNDGPGMGFYGVYGSSISGLTCNTLYYVRAYATNSIGTAYGNTVSFSTASCGNEIACNSGVSYSGGNSYPAETIVALGSDIGSSILTYDALDIPDRFICYFNGTLVIDTGYKGAAAYNYGGILRGTFTASLTGRLDPIYGTTYPDFINYIQDGYPLLTGEPSGSVAFIKELPLVTEVTVRVYAPMSNTVWDFSVSCPQ